MTLLYGNLVLSPMKLKLAYRGPLPQLLNYTFRPFSITNATQMSLYMIFFVMTKRASLIAKLSLFEQRNGYTCQISIYIFLWRITIIYGHKRYELGDTRDIDIVRIDGRQCNNGARVFTGIEEQ